MTKSLLLFISFVLVFQLCSCNQIYDKQNPEPNTAENTLADLQNESSGTDVVTDFHESEVIVGIDLVDYPNPHAVSEYSKLTEDQKIAYDALSVALKDILENGPVANKEYTLTKRVSWYDYKLAYNIFSANFTAAERFILNLTSKDSLGTQEYVDLLFLFNDDQLDEYYQQYLEITTEAEKILSSLNHDGTDAGKAYAITEWLMNNISYPTDYQTRWEDDLGSVYTTLLTREAICDGHSKTFDFLSKKVGLETIYITSTPANAIWHSWNMICIDNKWYHIDTTWTEPSQSLRHFMISDEVCYSDHGQAEYYYNPLTLEYVIPKAPLCSSYGSISFDTATDAWNYINNSWGTDESLRFYFNDIDEMEAFNNYNERYVENLKKYVFVEKLYGNIMRIYFQ